MYLVPCITGILLSNNIKTSTIKVYDHKNNNVQEMEVSYYLTGVVAAEMPCEFENEALKAQAVAARTYLASKKNCEKYENCNICTDSKHCQAYKSPEELKLQWGNDYHKNYKKISKAVSETKDEIIIYNDKPISAVFHSTSSGKTENSEDVWGEKLPYLRSVDSYLDLKSPKYCSEKTYTTRELCKILNNKYNKEYNEIRVGEVLHTQGGCVKTIKINDTDLTGVKARELFSLNSANFDISVENHIVTFTTKGYGHGVGMSQYGANFLAKSGKKYKEIINHYYTGVKIEKSDFAYITR